MRRLLLVGLGFVLSIVAVLSFAPSLVAADACQVAEGSVDGTSASNEIDHTSTGIDFKKLLPAGWAVTYVDRRAKPYGWDQTPTGLFGLSVRLEGPRSIKGSEGGTPSEALTLCGLEGTPSQE